MQKENQASKYAPANRLTGVSEYYFSKKLKEVAQMNAEGKNVISLGIGSPDMPPSEQTVSTPLACARSRIAGDGWPKRLPCPACAHTHRGCTACK